MRKQKSILPADLNQQKGHIVKTSLTCPAANGNSASATYKGGASTLAVFGTFDSGTVKLQLSYDAGTTWIDATDDNGDTISFTANKTKSIWLGGAPLVRVNLAGSSGGTAVTVEANYGLANTHYGLPEYAQE